MESIRLGCGLVRRGRSELRGLRTRSAQGESSLDIASFSSLVVVLLLLL